MFASLCSALCARPLFDPLIDDVCTCTQQEFTVLQNGYFYRSLGDGLLVEAAGEAFSNLSLNLPQHTQFYTAGNVPYKGQNGMFLKMPHAWELAPSDADSLSVCGAIFEFMLISFSTWLLIILPLLQLTHLQKQGHMDGIQGGWCWETGAAFTQVFLVQPASSIQSAFSLRLLRVNFVLCRAICRNYLQQL